MSAVPRDLARPGGWRVRVVQHRRAAVDALGRLRDQPLGSALTVLVLALALLLPLGLAAALYNVQQLAGDLADAGEIHLYLEADTPLPQAEAMAARLRARDDVAAVVVRTPEEGLAEFREHSGLAPALDLLEGNPLPPVLKVQPAGAPAPLAAALAAESGVASVQYDAAWRARLQAWLGFARQLVAGLALLLVVAAVLVVGNTVRLDLAGRAAEIALLQQLGADDAYVTRPLRYFGALVGALAGAAALLLLLLGGALLALPVATLATSYGSAWALQPPPQAWWWGTLLAGTALGWLGAAVPAGHHVRSTRPVDP